MLGIKDLSMTEALPLNLATTKVAVTGRCEIEEPALLHLRLQARPCANLISVRFGNF